MPPVLMYHCCLRNLECYVMFLYANMKQSSVYTKKIAQVIPHAIEHNIERLRKILKPRLGKFLFSDYDALKKGPQISIF